ncbi:MAG: terminase small subunit [Clostridia bacterium]|nr:terminase small subunit [Clostridia bacterium]
MAKKPLSKREKLFCLNYAYLRNGSEAAARSGYTLNPKSASVKLLSRKEIAEEIAAVSNRFRPMQTEAATGYKRLAFGSAADALSLLFREEAPTKEELAEMDLFNVSEIKRPKGGGLEIKFFDRLKPLERLAEMSEGETAAALPFYEALNSSARALYGRDAFE